MMDFAQTYIPPTDLFGANQAKHASWNGFGSHLDGTLNHNSPTDQVGVSQAKHASWNGFEAHLNGLHGHDAPMPFPWATQDWIASDNMATSENFQPDPQLMLEYSISSFSVQENTDQP
jgi:hypothetical protein